VTHLGIRIGVVCALLVCALLGDGWALRAASADAVYSEAQDRDAMRADGVRVSECGAVGQTCKKAPAAMTLVPRVSNIQSKRVLALHRSVRDLAAACPTALCADAPAYRGMARSSQVSLLNTVLLI